MDNDFASIRDGLRRLLEFKGQLNVFGSQSHRFVIQPPVPESVVRDFEILHGIILPEEYKGFLVCVGNGGAGPAYGLFPLGIEDSGTIKGPLPWRQGDGFVGCLTAPFPHTEPWNDLEGMPEYEEGRENDQEWLAEHERLLDDWERIYWSTKNIEGAIPICHLGCAMRHWLVVTGPESGNVWQDDRVDHAGLKPLQRGGHQRTTFIQWYRDWLEEALRLL